MTDAAQFAGFVVDVGFDEAVEGVGSRRGVLPGAGVYGLLGTGVYGLPGTGVYGLPGPGKGLQPAFVVGGQGLFGTKVSALAPEAEAAAEGVKGIAGA